MNKAEENFKKELIEQTLIRAGNLLLKSEEKKAEYKKNSIQFDSMEAMKNKVAKEMTALHEAAKKISDQNGSAEYNMAVQLLVTLAKGLASDDE